tara:strand:+ start:5386 stop:5892 length:507 start_codon:yes stop_codon:yes gene_type:complete
MYQPIWPLVNQGARVQENLEVSRVDENGNPLPGYSPYTQKASYPFPNVHNICHSLRQDLLFLLYCSPGEWPGFPEMGVGLREYLFTNSTDPMWTVLETRIRAQVSEYLPWLEIDGVNIILNSEDVDNNSCKIIIKYAIPKLTCKEEWLEMYPSTMDRRWDFRWIANDR